uniref:Uncharacterized protein n=1 Tax=Glossina austeni TaxID=7395 RepID=A0A1A9UTC9_GLOAU
MLCAINERYIFYEKQMFQKLIVIPTVLDASLSLKSNQNDIDKDIHVYMWPCSYDIKFYNALQNPRQMCSYGCGVIETTQEINSCDEYGINGVTNLKRCVKALRQVKLKP